MIDDQGKYFVVRSHSHTDKQCLWKIMSRPFSVWFMAWQFKDSLASLDSNSKHEFFVVQIVDEKKALKEWSPKYDSSNI